MIIARDAVADDAAPAAVATGHPEFEVVADVRDDGGTVAVVAAGVAVCSARVLRRGFSSAPRWLGVRELVIDQFSARHPRLLREESDGSLPVLRELLRRAATESRWRWHVLTIVGDATESAVIGAAWRLATELELDCEIRWAGVNAIGVSMFGRGSTSRVARTIAHARGSAIVESAVSRLTGRFARRADDGGRGGLYVLDVIARTPPRRPVDGLAFREVDLALVARRPLLYADSVQGALEPLERGERCFVGEIDGQQVFRMWVGGPAAEWTRDMPPSLRSAPSWYVHDCHTIPEARRRGVYVAALEWLGDRARLAGACSLSLHVAGDNVPALRAVERAGFVRVGAAAEPRRSGLSLSRAGVLELVREVVRSGARLRVRAAGMSMWPTIPDGALVELGPVPPRLRAGQIVLLDWEGNAALHRIVRIRDAVAETRGDACVDLDPPIPLARIVALALTVEHGGRRTTLTGAIDHGAASWLRFARARMRLAAARVWRSVRHWRR